MASLTDGRYPPNLKTEEKDALIETVKDWSIGNGLAVRPPPTVIAAEADPKSITAINVPVTLFPSPFPKQCFAQGKAVQKIYNELYASVSRDEEFLAQVVKEVSDGDEFIRNLWEPVSLGLFRSDYMVHQDTETSKSSLQVKQVEFNTIASSFGGLSTHTSALHKYLATAEYPILDNSITQGSLDLPENTSTRGLAAGIVKAYNIYPDSELGHQKCVIFLVQDGERNIFDQRHLEYQISSSSSSIPVFRLPYSQILQHSKIADTSKRQLLYILPRNPSKVYEVAVIYMRSGYGPSDYPDQRAWEARYHLERSNAIKCPSVLTQLAGTKKVQQILATPRPSTEPSALSRFIRDDTDEAAELWRTFTNIYPMDSSDAGLEARKKALDPKICQNYVLKPQREGGGNNIYRGAIPDFLKSVPESHWGSYILMELITPPPVNNTILRNGNLEQGGVICELGIYGTCIWDQNTGKVHHNEEAGYLLRTKGDKSEEGGVAAGFGCMDSCALV
ncbi:glutathione synthetase [Fusarium proliferatum]|uniref:Glutathione synthetase n=1 Tax=Gibberella intermedia TaxID=948311 RepID=A0A365MLN7_GIBIN|nr:glutathione synthetase [Fusarium proliferatum]KAG4267705.1 glutathione synthetase [Fusarium proliferatum]KAG4290512.1 glutathione synthetase [Fusarium proliferatum]RBA09470.1 glutathione synthetase [Fusarium proliferatum]